MILIPKSNSLGIVCWIGPNFRATNLQKQANTSPSTDFNHSRVSGNQHVPEGIGGKFRDFTTLIEPCDAIRVGWHNWNEPALHMVSLHCGWTSQHNSAICSDVRYPKCNRCGRLHSYRSKCTTRGGIYFFFRKHFHSINSQIICDANLFLINVVARWPGSTHDSFMNSPTPLQFARWPWPSPTRQSVKCCCPATACGWDALSVK